MKTNTTKLRRALTAFAMTGAMLAVSELCPAAEHFSTDTTIEKKNETVDAGGSKYYTAGDSVTVNADFTGSTFSNARNDSGTNLSEGSIISNGNWTITGGTFTSSHIMTESGGTGNYIANGGAVGGSAITLNGTTFTGNYAKSGDITESAGTYVTSARGGAVFGSLVTVTGTNKFTGNYVSSGNITYSGTNGGNNSAIGGAIGAESSAYNVNAIVIGGSDVDNITFSDNHADALYETAGKTSSQGGAVGGALGTNVGKIVINAEAGDKITFSGNTAQAQYSRAVGGAIAAGREGSNGTVVISAEDGATVLFEGNKAISKTGATRVYGGAIYSRADVDVTNAEFKNNEAVLKAGDGGDLKVGGGAIFMHKDGKINITDSTFTGNVANGENVEAAIGGAINAEEAVLTFSGTNKFENNSVSNTNASGVAQGGAVYGNDVVFSGDDSSATFTGNKANGKNNDIHVIENGSVTITDAGTYSFGGGITTDAGGTLTISKGANVTFENGSITDIKGEMTLAGANLTLNIDDATKFTVGSITASGNHQLMVNYDGTNDLVLTTGTVTGLTNAKVNFTNKTFGDGELGYLDMTNGLAIVLGSIEEETAGIFNRLSGSILKSSSNSFKDLGTAVDGDQIIVTKNTTLAAGDSIKVPANLTISSNNSTTNRTINANGASSIFSTAGTSALTLENITISGASNHAGVVGGSVITSGNWNIIGGTFSGNSITTPEGGSGDYAAKGGAIYGGTLNLQDVTFTDNIASSGDIGAARGGSSNYVRTQTMGGAVYGSSVTISGNSDFSNNRIETGNVFYKDANGQITRWMDETIGGAVFSENLNIGAEDVQDNVTFSGNVADSTKTTGSASAALGGSIGGAAGADAGTITVTAKDGDKIAFTGNKAESNYSRALGGAVGAGRNTKGSVSIKAEGGGEILFKDNTAVNNKGTMTAMGGAVFGLQKVEAEGAVFENNTAQVNVTDEAGNPFVLFDYDEVTAHSAHGGAIASHNSFGDSVVTVKDSKFTGNKVEVTGNAVEGVQANALGGAVYAAAKDGVGTGKVELSGTNVFENNSASSTAGDAKGGAIYGDTVTFNGGKSTFIGNTANGVQNDVHAETAVAINGGTHHFGGGITTGENGKLDITNAAVSFGNNAIVSVHGGTITGSTLDLGKGVKIDGLGSVTVDSLTFKADPTANGFSSISGKSLNVGTATVGLNVFTVGAMDNTTNTLTLIDGGKAGKVNITNGDLMTLTDDTAKTAVTINQDKDGTTYGSAPVQGSELVGIDFGGKDSLEVHNFSLIVDGKDIDLNAFANWLGENTGLDTSVGTGYVSVRLETPFEIMADDSFIWDFSGYDGIANLQFASVNMMDSTVPEPTTWALLVLGGLGIFGVARKNRKAKK